jgi:hypothetical protein
MFGVVICNHCQTRVLPLPDNRCPACQKIMDLEQPTADSSSAMSQLNLQTVPPPLPVNASPVPKSVAPSRASQAAKASQWSPLVGIMMNVAGGSQDRRTQFLIAMASFCIYILGLILGVGALLFHGSFTEPGSMRRAITGVAINGIIVAAFVAVIVMAG